MTHAVEATNLADILERVLDKGIVIAGDIRIQIADIDLLTIKIRLMIASVENAIVTNVLLNMADVDFFTSLCQMLYLLTSSPIHLSPDKLNTIYAKAVHLKIQR